MSTLTVKIMASKYHLPLKELGILRERSDVKVEAGNIQGKPASLHTKSNTNIKKNIKAISKGLRRHTDESKIGKQEH